MYGTVNDKIITGHLYGRLSGYNATFICDGNQSNPTTCEFYCIGPTSCYGMYTVSTLSKCSLFHLNHFPIFAQGY